MNNNDLISEEKSTMLVGGRDKKVHSFVYWKLDLILDNYTDCITNANYPYSWFDNSSLVISSVCTKTIVLFWYLIGIKKAFLKKKSFFSVKTEEEEL